MKKIFGYINALRLYALKYYLILKHYPKISIEGKFILEKRCEFKLAKGSKLIIKGNLVLMSDVLIQAREGAVITLGKNCFMNRFCSLISHTAITLGDNVMLGENVKIYDNDHAIEGNVIMRKKFVAENISIGDNSWLANNVVILKGSTVGNNVVVGAQGLVKGELESNSIYAGVPCRKIKKLEPKETTQQ
jgi:acetyltransferase-like isoleucine patch superfamily enzyme